MLMAETLVLSNLGRIPDGELGIELRDVHFSPPGTTPFGLGLGAVTLDDRLQLTLRHRWNLWSSSACAAFVEVLLDELAALTSPVT